jgi:hypothetical protein
MERCCPSPEPSNSGVKRLPKVTYKFGSAELCLIAESDGGWTGAPRSPQPTPDFRCNVLALANLMRLFLTKAAHADVGGAPCGKSGYVGRKRRAKPRDSSSLDRPTNPGQVGKAINNIIFAGNDVFDLVFLLCIRARLQPCRHQPKMIRALTPAPPSGESDGNPG